MQLNIESPLSFDGKKIKNLREAQKKKKNLEWIKYFHAILSTFCFFFFFFFTTNDEFFFFFASSLRHAHVVFVLVSRMWFFNRVEQEDEQKNNKTLEKKNLHKQVFALRMRKVWSGNTSDSQRHFERFSLRCLCLFYDPLTTSLVTLSSKILQLNLSFLCSHLKLSSPLPSEQHCKWYASNQTWTLEESPSNLSLPLSFNPKCHENYRIHRFCSFYTYQHNPWHISRTVFTVTSPPSQPQEIFIRRAEFCHLFRHQWLFDWRISLLCLFILFFIVVPVVPVIAFCLAI